MSASYLGAAIEIVTVSCDCMSAYRPDCPRGTELFARKPLNRQRHRTPGRAIWVVHSVGGLHQMTLGAMRTSVGVSGSQLSHYFVGKGDFQARHVLADGTRPCGLRRAIGRWRMERP
jgi:hypothetical protein